MAEFKINGHMKVKTLKELFFNEFEGTLRVYDGKKLADDEATLASIRSNEGAKGGELSCRASRTVGKFEQEMWDVFGIKVQVATKDNWVLVLDGITLSKIKDIPNYAKKETMEEFVSYKRKDSSSVVEENEVEVSQGDEEKEVLQECKIDWWRFWGWMFVFDYESNGENNELNVDICSRNDGSTEFHLDGKSIGLIEGDFAGCIDFGDCSSIIAKRIIKDNDGEVSVKFVDENEETLTGIPFEMKLNKDLEYVNEDADDESWELTLSADCDADVHRYDIYNIDEEYADQILELFENGDAEGLNDFLWDFCDGDEEVLEVLDLGGGESISYEVCNEDGDEVCSGEMEVRECNIFDKLFMCKRRYYIADENSHSKYLLLKVDTVKRSYATFTVPRNFQIGEIHFLDSRLTPTWLPWDMIGDSTTDIVSFIYRGEEYIAGDYGDAGYVNDIHYAFFKWDDDKKRYDLLGEM